MIPVLVEHPHPSGDRVQEPGLYENRSLQTQRKMQAMCHKGALQFGQAHPFHIS
jgi:hypothetical protein